MQCAFGCAFVAHGFLQRWLAAQPFLLGFLLKESSLQQHFLLRRLLLTKSPWLQPHNEVMLLPPAAAYLLLPSCRCMSRVSCWVGVTLYWRCSKLAS